MDAPILDYLRKYRFKKVQLVNDSATGLRARVHLSHPSAGAALRPC